MLSWGSSSKLPTKQKKTKTDLQLHPHRGNFPLSFSEKSVLRFLDIYSSILNPKLLQAGSDRSSCCHPSASAWKGTEHLPWNAEAKMIPRTSFSCRFNISPSPQGQETSQVTTFQCICRGGSECCTELQQHCSAVGQLLQGAAEAQLQLTEGPCQSLFNLGDFLGQARHQRSQN